MKTVLAAILLIATFYAAPLYAGMEPFWRGAWGMSMNEISALENRTPISENYAPPADGLTLLAYAGKILGYNADIVYIFSHNRLIVAGCNIQTENFSLEEAEVLTEKLNTMALGTLTAPQKISFSNMRKNRETGARQWWVHLALQQDAFSAVTIIASYVVNEKHFSYDLNARDKHNPVNAETMERFYEYWEEYKHRN